jgi:FecR protein
MKTYNRMLGVLVVLALISVSALTVVAQDQGPDQVQVQGQDQSQAPPPPDGQTPPQGSPENDPPTVAARLQFMSGSVSVQPHGTEDWVAGALNRPLTNSDNIWADKNSRAEINAGSGLIRIDSESSLTLTSVTDRGVQLQLHQGAMYLHVRDLDGQTYEVDTPNQAFAVQKPGDYRFDVNPDADSTVVTVWQGQGQSTGNGPAVLVHENEQARFSDGTSLKNEMHAAPPPDAFDQWAQSRDERFDHSQSARYVSPNVVGSDDLDEYGSWRDSPDYGHVWVPSGVSSDWAPYRDGHWIWVAPWGWTWVDDEPWGYAPFHYGRWVYGGGYWGWAPGPYYARPYYAPALVAWFGGGRGWGVGVGFGGGYGWCPLGFGEPFIPWYGVSRGYFNRVNITNTHITNITNVYNNNYINRGGLHGGEPMHYANLNVRNGFTAVNRDTLVNSRNVAQNNIRVSPNEMSRMSPARSLDVRLGANAGRTAAMPPPRTFARPVVSRDNAGALHGSAGVADRNAGVIGRNNSRPAMGDGHAVQPNLPNRGSYEPGNSGPRYVPRPPSAGPMSPGNAPQNNSRPASVPRPAPTYTPRSQGSDSPRSAPPPQSNSKSNDRSGGPRSDVRPMNNNNGGSSGYSTSGDRGSYSTPSYGGGSYSRPAPAPSYDRGSYSRPVPTYNGGGSYSRPAPAYGGSSGRSAPAYSGGNSGRSSGYPGGGNSGGGHASAPARSSGGGGGGGSRSNGGGRGRH